MLYVNEKVELWDAETDEAVKTPEEIQAEIEIQKRIQDGKTLQTLKRTKGWKLVNKFLIDQIEDYKNLIAREQDMRKLRRLQEAIKAYTNVMAYVDWAIQEGQSFENHKTPEDQG